MEEHLDDSVQVLLAVAISAKILENEKRESLRGFSRSFNRSLGGSRFV